MISLILTMTCLLLLFSYHHFTDEESKSQGHPVRNWVPGGSTNMFWNEDEGNLSISLCCSWSSFFVNRVYDRAGCSLQPDPLPQVTRHTFLHFLWQDTGQRDPFEEFLLKASCENRYGTFGMMAEEQKPKAGDSRGCIGSALASSLAPFHRLFPSMYRAWWANSEWEKWQVNLPFTCFP